MKQLAYGSVAALAFGILLLAGCGAEPESVVITAPPQEIVVQQTVVVPAEPMDSGPSGAPAEPLQHPVFTPAAVAMANQDAVNEGGEEAASAAPPQANRLIIKDGEITLTVEDTNAAFDRVTQIADDVGGYIISSRTWYQEWSGESYKYATITIGVPSTEFERALSRLRNLAVHISDETISGQDVTDEYVDLQSRLGNLEATRDRIREFLDQAQTVEEALEVNQELAAVEEEIELVQGRMNYLFDRASFSTFTIHIQPQLPPATLTPTPSPTPTPTPTPTPSPTPRWSASPTFERASGTFVSILHAMIELVIWIGVVFLPFIVPSVLVAWVIARVIRRRAGRGG